MTVQHPLLARQTLEGDRLVYRRGSHAGSLCGISAPMPWYMSGHGLCRQADYKAETGYH
jgi:hypothetical protein